MKYLCRETRFRHKWWTADHLVALCHEWYTIPGPLQFNANDLNNALLKDPALKLDMQAESQLQTSLGSITIRTAQKIPSKEIIVTIYVIQMEMIMSRVHH